MRNTVAAYCLLASAIGIGSAAAADCPGNPDALGTSRTIVVDPTEHQFLGAFQYRESLPLKDREVVLTFDDGPLPPYTTRILDVLAAECVKATFFMVGRMARSYPPLVKRAYAEGHTLANHSQSHPFTFHKMTVDQARQEIEDGFASIRTALGNSGGVANFFRIPGLLRQESVEKYLSSRDYMTWSVDFAADDWTRISASEVVRRAISRLESRGKGILLLHDIQPATALGLPDLLRELKQRGFKVVNVVQASAERPKTATLPEMWAISGRTARAATLSVWPRVRPSGLYLPEPVLAVPGIANLGIANPADAYATHTASLGGDWLRTDNRNIPLRLAGPFQHSIRLVAASPADVLPAPDAANFRYSRVWKPRAAVTRAVPAPKKTVTRAHPTAAQAISPGSLRPPRPIGHQI